MHFGPALPAAVSHEDLEIAGSVQAGLQGRFVTQGIHGREKEVNELEIEVRGLACRKTHDGTVSKSRWYGRRVWAFGSQGVMGEQERRFPRSEH